MNYPHFTATAFAAFVAATAGLLSPAAASDDKGCNVPQAERQPESALRQKLEGEGWQVKRVKTDDGCYEVYALDAGGQRREVYFDPRTLQPVAED